MTLCPTLRRYYPRTGPGLFCRIANACRILLTQLLALLVPLRAVSVGYFGYCLLLPLLTYLVVRLRIVTFSYPTRLRCATNVLGCIPPAYGSAKKKKKKKKKKKNAPGFTIRRGDGLRHCWFFFFTRSVRAVVVDVIIIVGRSSVPYSLFWLSSIWLLILTFFFFLPRVTTLVVHAPRLTHGSLRTCSELTVRH